MMEPEILTAAFLELSPFHAGERAIQERLGIREQTENLGRRLIREAMPDQHRSFFQQLPFLILGRIDPQGRPWAGLIAGEPGFVTSANPITLDLQPQLQVGHPRMAWVEGEEVGILGIDLQTRRRNRANGTVQAIRETGIAIAVKQSFGNCPQFIQKRQEEWLPERFTRPVPVPEPLTHLNAPMQALIAAADTLFLASHSGGSQTGASYGVDVSHRGGKPGFVRLEGDGGLIFPDFAGNNFFNTLGNLLLNPRIGVLFLDFAAGDVLSVTGKAEILWEGSELAAFTGAERLVRVQIDQIIHQPAVLPWRWHFQEYSPALEFTGTWPAKV